MNGGGMFVKVAGVLLALLAASPMLAVSAGAEQAPADEQLQVRATIDSRACYGPGHNETVAIGGVSTNVWVLDGCVVENGIIDNQPETSAHATLSWLASSGIPDVNNMDWEIDWVPLPLGDPTPVEVTLTGPYLDAVDTPGYLRGLLFETSLTLTPESGPVAASYCQSGSPIGSVVPYGIYEGDTTGLTPSHLLRPEKDQTRWGAITPSYVSVVKPPYLDGMSENQFFGEYRNGEERTTYRDLLNENPGLADIYCTVAVPRTPVPENILLPTSGSPAVGLMLTVGVGAVGAIALRRKTRLVRV